MPVARPRRVEPLFAVTVAVAIAACGVGCGPGGAPRSGAPAASGRTVSLALPSDGGQLVSIPAPGARAVVLDFFGPTCEPCKKKVPELVARKAAIEQKGARLFLVAVLADGETTDAARSALASWGVKASFLVDAHDASRKEVGFSGLPATVVIDGEGRVIFTAQSSSTADDVVAALP